MAPREEESARALYDALLDRCPEGTGVSIHGSGASWHCIATRHDRYCSMACSSPPDGAPGAGFLCYYRIGVGVDAMGRSGSLEETVEAAVRWTAGDTVAEMQRRFAFVDAPLKALTAARDALVARSPGIAAVRPELHESSTREFSLHIEAGDRSFALSLPNGGSEPLGVFSWRGLRLFTTRDGDPDVLGPLIQRWVCDRAMPETMRAEFPGTEMGRAADYFEAGRFIEGEFVESWDQVDAFCAEMTGLGWPQARSMARLLAELRRAGYDTALRAGTSLVTLLVSRSRHHGLRPDQPFVAFSLDRSDDNKMVVSVRDQRDMLVSDVALTPEVAAILRALAEHPVD